jgi:SAM-dependent methyltransferase
LGIALTAAQQATGLCCPSCRGSLTQSETGYTCAPCATEFPVRDGVPSFTQADYYYGTLPQESATEAIELAKANRLSELKERLKEQKGLKVFFRSFDESFADGRFLIPITEESEILDIGCGFGGLSFPIARTAKRVVAADATFERVAFLARRAAADNVSNIEPIHADGLKLPLSNDQFDFVFLNGVLEWMGEWEQTQTPREVQLGALRSVRDLLKEDGTLYLAIENRWAAELVYRRKDHNKLRWTTFMPRPMADLFTRWLKKKPYRTYTYGHDGFVKLLKEAGFPSTEFYIPYPRYQDPANIIRWRDQFAARYFRNKVMRQKNFAEYLLFSLLSRLGLDWEMAPAFIILAKKR